MFESKKQTRKLLQLLTLTTFNVLSLMENVRVRRAGYAFRQLYEIFLKRYKMLCPATWPNWRGQPKDGVREILNHLKLTKDKEEFAYGRTKIFIRNPRTVCTQWLCFHEERPMV